MYRFVSCVCLLFALWTIALDGCLSPILLPDTGCFTGECRSVEKPVEKALDASVAFDSLDAQEPRREPDTEPGWPEIVQWPGPDVPVVDREWRELPKEPSSPIDRRSPDKSVIGPKPCEDKDKDKRCANRIHPTYRVDCDDNDPNVFPGQVRFFAVRNKRGNYDYNCNGTAEPRVWPLIDCSNLNTCRQPKSGIVRRVACGQALSWANGCKISPLLTCVPSITKTLKQECR